MRKRILCTVTNDLNYDQRMQRICSSLISFGYDVELIGRKRRQSLPLDSLPFHQKRLFCFFEKGKLFYLEYNLRLFFYLLFKKADIICAVDLDTILPALLVKKLKGNKLVYDAHEYFTEVPEVIHRPQVQKIWQKLALYSIPQADLCYTVSLSLSMEFFECYQKHFFVVRNMPFKKSSNIIQLPAKDKFILYQGALNKGRGLEQLIEAMLRLPLKLMLAGEGDLSKSLRAQVEKLGLKDKVTFLGYLKPDELKKLTPSAFLGYNMLEIESKSYYYSLSNKFFDYIQAGIPSLSNPLPEYESVIKAYKIGKLCELTVENIVACVNAILDDEEEYQQMKANCLIAKEVYNWENESKKLKEIYAAL